MHRGGVTMYSRFVAFRYLSWALLDRLRFGLLTRPLVTLQYRVIPLPRYLNTSSGTRCILSIL